MEHDLKQALMQTDSQPAKFTKAHLYEVMKLFKEGADCVYQFENEMRKTNPFWPHRMTPELLQALKKWSEHEN